MSWNEALSLYQQERGGTFLGRRDEKWMAELVLNHQDTPLIVRGEVMPVGQNRFRKIRVFTILPMEKDYELDISSKNVLAQGLNLALPREDYGCPELSRTRRIRTNDAAFTRRLLSDWTLRRCLEAWPSYPISVAPGFFTTAGTHVIEVYIPMFAEGDELSDTSTNRPPSLGPGAEIRQRYGAEPEEPAVDNEAFTLRMDGVIDLVKAARDAVAAWPMGVKERDK